MINYSHIRIKRHMSMQYNEIMDYNEIKCKKINKLTNEVRLN